MDGLPPSDGWDDIRSKYGINIDRDAYEPEKLEPPDWITDLDREILALLGNLEIIATPSVIAKNIDRSRSSVSRRLNTLEAGGMVEKVERGHYRITDEGWARMVEKVTASGQTYDAEELETISPKWRIPSS